MNLYILRRGTRRANSVEVLMLDAESKIVGRITNEVADYLIQKGVAMDISERKEQTNA